MVNSAGIVTDDKPQYWPVSSVSIHVGRSTELKGSIRGQSLCVQSAVKTRRSSEQPAQTCLKAGKRKGWLSSGHV